MSRPPSPPSPPGPPGPHHLPDSSSLHHSSHPGAPISSAASMRRLWVLMATVFVDMIGAMIVLPLLPFYVLRMGGKPSIVGPLVSAFFVTQIVFSPLWGRLSDRYGRRPMILAGLLLSAAAYTLFGLAHTLLLLFLSRLVQGAGSGTVGVVQAYVGDSIAPEERAKALGWVTSATSAGVGIGALIGYLATFLGQSAPGYCAAGLCLLNVVFAWRWLPESKRRETAPVEAPPMVSVWGRLWTVVRQPTAPIGSLIWIYALGMMIFMAMNTVLSLYLQRIYGVTQHTIYFFYAYVSLISVVMRALLLGPAVRRVGEVGAMRLGTLMLAIGMGAMPFPAWLASPPAVRIACFALIATLVPVGTALLFPSTTALVSRRSPRDELGQVMGVQQLFGGIARFLGPIWSAWLFAEYVALPFWVASILMLGGSLLTWRIRREPRVHPVAALARVEVSRLTVIADLPDACAAAELSQDEAAASAAPSALRG
jgi:MFS family permease